MEKKSNGLGPPLTALVVFAALWAIIFLLSSIWNAVWTSWVFDDVMKEISSAKTLRIEVAALCALGFFTLLVFGILCGFLYFCGHLFCIHFAFAILTVLSIIAEFIFMVSTLIHSRDSKVNEYKNELFTLINDPNRPQSIAKWMDEKSCIDSETCNKEVDDFIHLRTYPGFVADAVIVSLELLSVVGIIITVASMCFIKPQKQSKDVENMQQSNQPPATNLERQLSQNDVEKHVTDV